MSSMLASTLACAAAENTFFEALSCSFFLFLFFKSSSQIYCNFLQYCSRHTEELNSESRALWGKGEGMEAGEGIELPDSLVNETVCQSGGTGSEASVRGGGPGSPTVLVAWAGFVGDMICHISAFPPCETANAPLKCAKIVALHTFAKDGVSVLEILS